MVRYLFYTIGDLTYQSPLVTMKRKQLDHKLRSLYWLIGRKSQLSLSNKLPVFTLTLKPIWTYGIQLWGSASNSHLDTLDRFQSKALRLLTNAPWFVPNAIIRNDLRVTTIRQEVKKHYNTYRQRLAVHPNHLAITLLQGLPCNKRLKRHYPEELVTRFNYQYVRPPVSKIDPCRLNLKGNASLEVSPSWYSYRLTHKGAECPWTACTRLGDKIKKNDLNYYSCVVSAVDVLVM